MGAGAMKGFVCQQQDINVSEKEGKSWSERLMSWCEMSSGADAVVQPQQTPFSSDQYFIKCNTQEHILHPHVLRLLFSLTPVFVLLYLTYTVGIISVCLPPLYNSRNSALRSTRWKEKRVKHSRAS